MKISTRKERFLRVSKNRLERALAAIESIEKLSNKSNYDYEESDINNISGRLMAKVKLVMSSFGSYSAVERFERLVEQDQLQYRLLKESDPEVYKLVQSYLTNSNPINAAYTSIQDSKSKEDELLGKLENLYDKLLKNNLQNDDEYHADDDFFILDPEFDMSKMRAQHNIDRLLWLKRGRTFNEVISLNSPYRIHPDNEKTNPRRNLYWDISNGRVIQASNNKFLLKK